MFIFKTSGSTFDSVISYQKHAFRYAPKDWLHGEYVLVSKNKMDCNLHEKQIQYMMRIEQVREAEDSEINLYWPGNNGRWNYIVDCYGTKTIAQPFDLDEALGEEASYYKSIVTYGKILAEHEIKILPYL